MSHEARQVPSWLIFDVRQNSGVLSRYSYDSSSSTSAYNLRIVATIFDERPVGSVHFLSGEAQGSIGSPAIGRFRTPSQCIGRDLAGLTNRQVSPGAARRPKTAKCLTRRQSQRRDLSRLVLWNVVSK